MFIDLSSSNGTSVCICQGGVGGGDAVFAELLHQRRLRSAAGQRLGRARTG